MASALTMSTLLPRSSPPKTKPHGSSPRICFPSNKPSSLLNPTDQTVSGLSTFQSHHHLRVCVKRNDGSHDRLSPGADSSPSEYTEEPKTKVKFPNSVRLPGCVSSLSLLGTGYREKVFAIIGVKVYAAGLYVSPSIFSELDTFKGRSPAQLRQYSLVFDAIFRAPLEKSLHIVLVRDVDGETFWDALDEAISPRITSPTPIDQSAISTFRSIFQGRPLKKGTAIFLTWLNSRAMLVCVSPDGDPTSVDGLIESSNVTSALFDVFFGGNPVSPSLKASVTKGLAAALK